MQTNSGSCALQLWIQTTSKLSHRLCSVPRRGETAPPATWKKLSEFLIIRMLELSALYTKFARLMCPSASRVSSKTGGAMIILIRGWHFSVFRTVGVLLPVPDYVCGGQHPLAFSPLREENPGWILYKGYKFQSMWQTSGQVRPEQFQAATWRLRWDQTLRII